MAILREPRVWRRERAANETRRSDDLTPEEQANVRRALLVLRARLGGWPKLAAALQAKRKTVARAGAYGRTASAGLAVRAARLAGVPLEDVLAGRWPVEGACPHCGRT